MRSEYKQPVSTFSVDIKQSWAVYPTVLRDAQLGSSVTWRSELRERRLWRGLNKETGVQK